MFPLNLVVAILYCYVLSAFLFCLIMLVAMTQHIAIPKSTAMAYIGWGAVFICLGSIFSILI